MTIRVALVSRHDYGGSGWMIKRAVETQPGFEVKHIRLHTHKYGYPSDITCHPADIHGHVKDCDIIHCKGDDPPSSFLPKDVIRLGKPTIITVGGRHFRRRRPGLNRQISLQQYPQDAYFGGVHSRVALTPDLNYPWFDGRWIPAPTECPSTPRWNRPVGTMKVAHSPSSRVTKGTDTVFLPAIKRLMSEGHSVEPLVIEGASHDRCLDLKRSSALFWDQAIVGAYGNSSLEAMRLGIPTMCWISGDSLAGARGALDECPIVSFEPTPEGCYTALKEMIHSDLFALSQKTFEWTRKTHGLHAVGTEYAKEYRRIL